MNKFRKLPFSNYFSLHRDEQLEIIQGGRRLYSNSIRNCGIVMLLVVVVIFFLFRLYEDENVLSNVINSLIFTFIMLIPIMIYLIEERRVITTKPPHQKLYVSLLTEKPLNKNQEILIFGIDSHEVFIPLDRKPKRKGDFFQYNSVSIVSNTEENGQLQNKSEKEWLNYKDIPHFLFTMEKQVLLCFGIKNVSFSLSYTNPEDSRVFQRPTELFIIVKDLSLVEGTLSEIQEEK